MAVTSSMRGRISRRTLIRAGAAGTALLAAPAIAQSRRKVGVAYGIATLDSSADAAYASIPMHFGFYEEEGLDVEIMPVAGAGAAINLMAAGRASFTVTGSSGLFSGVSNGVPMVAFMCPIPDYYTSVGVLKDGPIQKFEDLKGKIIGVSSATGGPTLPLKAAMRRLGWDPEKDVQMIAVGTSLPALEALRRGRVQALLLWDSIFALFEANGTEFRHFVPDPMPKIGFSQCNSTMQATVQNDSDLVSKMSRAMAKSIVIMAAAEPAELTKLHFKTFPASKPTGLTDQQLIDLDGRRLAARRKFMRLEKRVFSRQEKIGDVEDAQVEFFAQMLHDGGEIKQAYPASRYFTRQFLAAMNDIDVPGLIAKARAFRA